MLIMAVTVIALLVIDVLDSGFVRMSANAIEANASDPRVRGAGSGTEGDGGSYRCCNQALFH
jgi:hypothetical protein